MISRLIGEVEEGILDRLQAKVQSQIGSFAARVVVLASTGCNAAAGIVFLEDDVDNAGDGVTSVLCCRAFLQDFDAGHGAEADEVQVGGGTTLERTPQDGEVRGTVAALAVDQHQGVVGAQAAQFGRKCQVGGVAAERLGVERRHILRNRLDKIRLSDPLQGGGIEHCDGRRTVDGPEACRARARDNDGFDVGGFSLCVGCLGTARHGGPQYQGADARE